MVAFLTETLFLYVYFGIDIPENFSRGRKSEYLKAYSRFMHL